MGNYCQKSCPQSQQSIMSSENQPLELKDQVPINEQMPVCEIKQQQKSISQDCTQLSIFNHVSNAHKHSPSKPQLEFFCPSISNRDVELSPEVNMLDSKKSPATNELNQVEQLEKVVQSPKARRSKQFDNLIIGNEKQINEKRRTSANKVILDSQILAQFVQPVSPLRKKNSAPESPLRRKSAKKTTSRQSNKLLESPPRKQMNSQIIIESPLRNQMSAQILIESPGRKQKNSQMIIESPGRKQKNSQMIMESPRKRGDSSSKRLEFPQKEMGLNREMSLKKNDSQNKTRGMPLPVPGSPKKQSHRVHDKKSSMVLSRDQGISFDQKQQQLSFSHSSSSYYIVRGEPQNYLVMNTQNGPQILGTVENMKQNIGESLMKRQDQPSSPMKKNKRQSVKPIEQQNQPNNLQSKKLF